MITDLFQIAPIPNDQLKGIYDLRLVTLSFMVAVFASYIALDLTGRLRDRNNTQASSLLWLLGGSIAMGAGIWSMHFIGMLSFTIPGLTLQYDLFWTALSLGVAIFASGFALFLLKISLINVIHLVMGGVILGLGIASMHYTGMAAMLITLNIKYLPGLFLLSILIAIVASEAAIWLALKSNRVILRLRTRIKFGSAIIMGIAICGMHYTGMAASIFTLCEFAPKVENSLDPTILSMAIAAVTFVILGIAFFASTYKEAINQQQFEKARQLGMAEIAASVLHNVGNVLNSINVSAGTIDEKISSSKLSSLEKLCALLNDHKHDLATFMTEDPRGTKAVDFLNELAKYLREEQQYTAKEIKNLMKNSLLINEIISTQQNLSKTTELQQVTSINELLDEALLITGLDFKKDIAIEKQYGKFDSILVDKVKLLQVLVNLLRNAKEALLESSNQPKKLVLKTAALQPEKILIQISENGIGILPKNIERIFNYGFTTKATGHGFGLHTTALSINELGGEIHVASEGHEKGATFRIELPYTLPR